MNQLVENLLRPLRSRVACRCANPRRQCIRSHHPECATANDEGASNAQQGFHNAGFRLNGLPSRGKSDCNRLLNEKRFHLNTTAMDGINLYLIGTRPRGLGV